MEKPNIKPIPFTNLRAQFVEHEEEIRSAIDSVLVSGRFIGGAEVLRLEEELAAFAGARFAIACSSGTDALLVSLLTLGVGPGDEVITTPFTFFATAAAVLGATPVFADICPDTLLIDADAIAERITEKTAAIIPVGLYGTPVDPKEYPATEDASAKVVSLPISPYLTQEEQDRVIDAVKRVAGTRI